MQGSATRLDDAILCWGALFLSVLSCFTFFTLLTSAVEYQWDTYHSSLAAAHNASDHSILASGLLKTAFRHT